MTPYNHFFHLHDSSFIEIVVEKGKVVSASNINYVKVDIDSNDIKMAYITILKGNAGKKLLLLLNQILQECHGDSNITFSPHICIDFVSKKGRVERYYLNERKEVKIDNCILGKQKTVADYITQKLPYIIFFR